MKLFRLFSLTILTTLLIGCSSSQESVKKEILPSAKKVPSQTSSSHLKIKIPIGWREVKDNKDQLFDIWLVNDENKAVIAFIPIYLTDDLLEKSEEEKLTLIEKIVINKKKSNVGNFEILDTKNPVLNQNSKSLKLLVDGNIHNSIVYGNGKNYYECLAYFSENYTPEDEEILALIDLQQQIVQKSVLK